MSVKTRIVNGIVVMDVSGRLINTEPVEQLYLAVEKAVASGSRQFALHMEAVEAMDSTGLKILVDCFKAIAAEKGRLVLIGMNERIRKLLEVTNIVKLMQSFDDEQTALASFKSN